MVMECSANGVNPNATYKHMTVYSLGRGAKEVEPWAWGSKEIVHQVSSGGLGEQWKQG